MNSPQEVVSADDSVENLSAKYARVRNMTLAICDTLQTEDLVVQSMPDVSPTKWHLAHVTWFFEKFVLLPYAPDYRVFDEQYHFLFNSYYYSAGDMHARPERGLLTRPTVQDVLDFRACVDAAMTELLDTNMIDAELEGVVLLGINHEQQHQELLLTDIKHVFSCNPLKPAVNAGLNIAKSIAPDAYRFTEGPAGIRHIGAIANGFCFDNETPRHQTLLHPHCIGSRLVTNGEFREFIRDGGYGYAAHWLSDGWATINSRGWARPLYWDEGLESEFTLGGQRDIDPHAPVTHVSYFEADAFARWAGARLPTEAEWETCAQTQALAGNFVGDGYWHPRSSADSEQFYGDAWEWTSSSYGPYPGFKPLAGSLGEYNGKFMCNQMTVRGGSCVTSIDHIRASYRSFFYPDARWQFLGIRLAKDD